MKRLITFLFIAFAFTAHAVDRVTITLTITNNPSAANTLTVNASTRTWRASVTAPATEVLVGASIGASATNLYRQLASYPLSGPVILGFSSTNIITIQGQAGQAMAASSVGTWLTVSYSTNTVTSMYMVRVPLSGEPAVPQTNNPTLLAVGMGTYSQSPFAAGTTLLENIVQIVGDQVIEGEKTFEDIVAFNGLTYFNETISVTGNIAITNASPVIDFYDSGGLADNKRTAVNADAEGFYVNFQNDDGTSGIVPLWIHRNASSGADRAEFRTRIAHKRVNHTALANGNNAGVTFGAYTYVKIKAGPSAAFAICGIVAGEDGDMLILDNSIAQNMTIANDSGVEPTAANRIYTRTGSDVSTTGQGVVTLIYDSEDSRWILVSVRD